VVPILPRFTDQRVADERKLEKILLETGPLDGPVTAAAGSTAGGDEQRRRGVPIIGRGIGGTSPGTDPAGETIRREQRLRRRR
jgi:hypothetical protein